MHIHHYWGLFLLYSLGISWNKSQYIIFLNMFSKHLQQIESLEGQIADALAERSKAAETISSLRVRKFSLLCCLGEE